MKPVIAFLAVALVAAACSEAALPTKVEFGVQPHFEIGVQEGSCPIPFTLAFVALPGHDPDGGAADRNGDGFACYLVTHVTESAVFRTWTDNNVPVNQIGACPNGFDLIRKFLETTGHDSDVNGDGWICTRVNGNGGTIEIDNNHRT